MLCCIYTRIRESTEIIIKIICTLFLFLFFFMFSRCYYYFCAMEVEWVGWGRGDGAYVFTGRHGPWGCSGVGCLSVSAHPRCSQHTAYSYTECSAHFVTKINRLEDQKSTRAIWQQCKFQIQKSRSINVMFWLHKSHIKAIAHHHVIMNYWQKRMEGRHTGIK